MSDTKKGNLVGGAVPPSPSAPRDAASLVLLRDGAQGMEVLMVQRNRAAAFMANAYVFPGGRVDTVDGGDFRVAAARETLEEAGIRVDPAQMIFFARWVTPATEPKRFDAHFFLAKTPDGQTGKPDPTGEVTDLRWATPAKLLDEQKHGGLKLPPPTIWHLTDLARHRTVEESLSWAKNRSVATVRPKLVPLEGTLAIVLPWDPEYAALPGDTEVIDRAHPVAGDVTRFVLEDDRWVGHSAAAH